MAEPTVSCYCVNESAMCVHAQDHFASYRSVAMRLYDISCIRKYEYV